MEDPKDSGYLLPDKAYKVLKWLALIALGEFADHPITMPRRAILTKDGSKTISPSAPLFSIRTSTSAARVAEGPAMARIVVARRAMRVIGVSVSTRRTDEPRRGSSPLSIRSRPKTLI